MNHAFGRRATTMAGTLAVAAAALLAVGGTATAMSDPSADRTADTSRSSSLSVQYGDSRGDDRENSNRRVDLYAYDNHRTRERNQNTWHRNSNGGQQYSYDSRQFPRSNAEKRDTVSAKAHELNDHTSHWPSEICAHARTRANTDMRVRSHRPQPPWCARQSANTQPAS
ncbi:hypothetical protein [Streptomyces sp. NPDC059224]|uniref:hypothetical protein n=1 Tax=Streptomyces sp. NPDC059224 TaxID=3346775 RepID=UPI0036950B1F